jgi:hypothetical protein
LFLNGAIPYINGINDIVNKKSDLNIQIEEKADGFYLCLKLSNDFTKIESKIINSFDLGEAMVPQVIFENPDGTSILFNQDYFNKSREGDLNSIGPFRDLSSGEQSIKVWNM